ncbi:hypothetical protein ACFQZX_15350 [Mucilaginibacter litoreus]|uniref:TonB protein C-terminal n=1 Tax=Mucilaginibacter litoreus TaxID=1048221 RepID=A0ABW3AVU5_9SPHI
MASKEPVVNKLLFFQIILLIFCLTPTTSFGQTSIEEAKFKTGDAALRKFLLTELDKIRKKHDLNVCLISVTFAKFSIDSAGNVTKLSFSENKDTPPVFRNILTKLILSTSGLWNPKKVNNRPVESKPFILPFIYQMEAGCIVNKKGVNNGTDAALMRLMEFEGEDKKTSQIDCTLLTPIAVFSQN